MRDIEIAPATLVDIRKIALRGRAPCCRWVTPSRQRAMRCRFYWACPLAEGAWLRRTQAAPLTPSQSPDRRFESWPAGDLSRRPGASRNGRPPGGEFVGVATGDVELAQQGEPLAAARVLDQLRVVQILAAEDVPESGGLGVDAAPAASAGTSSCQQRPCTDRPDRKVCGQNAGACAPSGVAMVSKQCADLIPDSRPPLLRADLGIGLRLDLRACADPSCGSRPVRGSLPWRW